METLYEFCIKNVPGLILYLKDQGIEAEIKHGLNLKESNYPDIEYLKNRILSEPDEVLNIGINWLSAHNGLRSLNNTTFSYSLAHIKFKDNYDYWRSKKFLKTFKNIKLV